MPIQNTYSPVYNSSNSATYTPTQNDNKFFTPSQPNRNRSITQINQNLPASSVSNSYKALYGNLFGADSQFSNAEQTVLQNMTSECISANGISVRYMPRRAPPGIGVDRVFNEVPESQFDTGFSIDSWISNIDGFEGDVVIQAYGLEIREEVDMIVSVVRFNQLAQPYDSDVYGRGDSEYVRTRPLEGDLMVIPFGISAEGGFQYVTDVLNKNIVVKETPQYFPKLFEILRVSTFSNGPFFQMGGNQQYRLHCRLFELSGETINFDSEYADYPPNAPSVEDSVVQYILDELRAYDSENGIPVDSENVIDIVNEDWPEGFGQNKAIEEAAQGHTIYEVTYTTENGKTVSHTSTRQVNPVIVQDYGKSQYGVPGVINHLDEI